MKLLTELDEACSGVDPPGSLTATVAGSRFRGRMYTEPPDKEIKDGKKATFLIKILFRQNASWQGSVAWLEGKREQSFRSALELLFLMDSVLSGKDAKAS